MMKKKHLHLSRLLARRLYRYMLDFKIAISAVLVFCLINVAVFVLLPTQPNQLHPLELSRGQPWGIFTAIFVHKDFNHLSTNLENLLFALLFFVSLSRLTSHSARILWSKRFVKLSLAAGVSANAVCYLLDFQLPAGGASGVVIAAVGILLWRLIADQRTIFKKSSITFKSKKKQLSMKQIMWVINLLRAMLSWMLLYTIVYPLITDYTGFFNIAEGVGWATHIIGFSLGLSIAFSLSIRDRFFNRSKS